MSPRQRRIAAVACGSLTVFMLAVGLLTGILISSSRPTVPTPEGPLVSSTVPETSELATRSEQQPPARTDEDDLRELGLRLAAAIRYSDWESMAELFHTEEELEGNGRALAENWADMESTVEDLKKTIQAARATPNAGIERAPLASLITQFQLSTGVEQDFLGQIVSIKRGTGIAAGVLLVPGDLDKQREASLRLIEEMRSAGLAGSEAFRWLERVLEDINNRILRPKSMPNPPSDEELLSLLEGRAVDADVIEAIRLVLRLRNQGWTMARAKQAKPKELGRMLVIQRIERSFSQTSSKIESIVVDRVEIGGDRASGKVYLNCTIQKVLGGSSFGVAVSTTKLNGRWYARE